MMPPEVLLSPPATPAIEAATVPWKQVEKFVGQLSHDLRNGLNACELQLTFLAEICTDPDAVEEVKRLRGTVADMTKQLQTVRVACGGVTAHLLDYPAVDLFEDLRERFQKLHPDLAGRVEWKQATGGDALVTVDPEITLAAGLELLRNALHFAPKDSRVICALGEEAGRGLLDVTQTLAEAPATPPDDWGRTPLTTTRRGAYGLGLFRVRRGLAAQGGELLFRLSPDAGTLTATLALRRADSSVP